MDQRLLATVHHHGHVGPVPVGHDNALAVVGAVDLDGRCKCDVWFSTQLRVRIR